MATCTEVPPRGLLDVLRRGALTEEQAQRIFRQGQEAVVFALLVLTKQLAQQLGKTAAQSHQTPSTPSGMKPPHQKPPGKSRKRRSGAKPGHPGRRRDVPEQVDWQVEHRADRCPDCGGRLKRCEETRTRYTEDIPEIQPEVTEHVIHRDWCPRCRESVEPRVPDALPGSQIGNRVLALAAWLHYGLGLI
jgi:transposase